MIPEKRVSTTLMRISTVAVERGRKALRFVIPVSPSIIALMGMQRRYVTIECHI